MTTSDLQVAGLVSGFDWKTFISQMMAIEHRPADDLAAEQAQNTEQSTLIGNITSKLGTLQTAADALSTAGVFDARTATLGSATSTWSATADTGATPGTYTFAVSQLATASQLTGATGISGKIAADGNVAAVTLANMPTAQAVTAGTFTVNGQQITVDLAGSLQDVFNAIATQTGNTVTASYDATTDKITLASSSGPLVLGAANDTSNFLSAVKLANNGTGTVTSSGALGAVKQNAVLSAANFANPITAVDASGNGSFSINNVTINYNVNTDTLASVITRINASTAGVNATFDATNGKLILTNKDTGNVGISVAEPAAGGFISAVGLASGTSFTAGQNALYSVNGGPTLTSASNTLSAASSGITGLAVTATTADTQTVTVAADTKTMNSKIQAFISAYNDVQSYIDQQTKVTSANGTVTTSPLSNNREVQDWADALRGMVFDAVSGATGTVTRLNDLGIDFNGTSNQLEVTDQTKLDAALADPNSNLGYFFGQSGVGFSAKLDAYIQDATKIGGDEQQQFTDENNSINDQIAAIERRIAQDQDQMTAAFQAMETAQSTFKQQQATLSSTFGSTTAAG